MARITVEDCIKLVNNQYDLVILAKERAVQLGRGATPAVDPCLLYTSDAADE